MTDLFTTTTKTHFLFLFGCPWIMLMEVRGRLLFQILIWVPVKVTMFWLAYLFLKFAGLIDISFRALLVNIFWNMILRKFHISKV
jgi:hypothetical protein